MTKTAIRTVEEARVALDQAQAILDADRERQRAADAAADIREQAARTAWADAGIATTRERFKAVDAAWARFRDAVANDEATLPPWLAYKTEMLAAQYEHAAYVREYKASHPDGPTPPPGRNYDGTGPQLRSYSQDVDDVARDVSRARANARLAALNAERDRIAQAARNAEAER